MTEFAAEMEREGVEAEQQSAQQAGQQRVEHRAHPLLPEEQRAGTDDAEAQARIILEDSDERTEHPERGAEESSQVADR